MKRAQFLQLCDVFWRSAPPERVERVYGTYREALSQQSPEAVDRAVRKALETLKRMPTPGDLLDLIGATVPRTYYSEPTGDGCPNCGGQPEQAVRDDGQAWRFYLRHTDRCASRALAKPDDLIWRRDWEGAGHKVWLPHEAVEPDGVPPRVVVKAVAGALGDGKQ